MSTIEKAAARLAARGRGVSPADERKAEVPPGVVDAPVGGRSAVPDVPLESQIRSQHSIHAEHETNSVIGHPLENVVAPEPASVRAPVSAGVASEQRHELDLDSIRDRGYLTPGSTRSALAQQMRRLKRPLLLKMQRARTAPEEGPPANLIMVTSSLPGEGKTFTSINLAMSMAAEVDHRVLLVDADPSRGDISRVLALPKRRGLSGLLVNGSDYCDGEILDTNIERLAILPSGDPIEHIDELFASTTMAGIAHALAIADPTRIVIFDCAPLLASTEVAVLAQLMGQIVVVVEANHTPQDAVLRALQMLDGCASVSLVLNKTTTGDDDSYGYGYGYGAFGGESAAQGQQAGGKTGEGR